MAKKAKQVVKKKKPSRAYIVKSGNVHWCTPEAVLDPVRRVLGVIELDPCGNKKRSIVKARRVYLLPTHDGLKLPWDGKTIFVNPPFGHGLRHWVERCLQASVSGSEVILILPAAVDTKYWQDIIWPTASGIMFPRSRIRFIRQNGKMSPAPMACGIVYWGKRVKAFRDAFDHLGYVIR